MTPPPRRAGAAQGRPPGRPLGPFSRPRRLAAAPWTSSTPLRQANLRRRRPRPIAGLPPGQPFDLQERDLAAVYVADLAHVEPPRPVPVDTGARLARDSPSSPHAPAPENRRDVSTDGEVPASSTTGDGRGVRSSQIPPSAVAATRCRLVLRPGQALPRLRRHCTASPSDRARSYSRQIGSRRDTAENSSTHSRISRSPRQRVARQQVGQRPCLRLGDRSLGGAFEHAVPGVGVHERGAAVQPRAEPPP